MKSFPVIIIVLLLASCTEHVLVFEDGSHLPGVSKATLDAEAQKQIYKDAARARVNAITSSRGLSEGQLVLLTMELMRNPAAGYQMSKTPVEEWLPVVDRILWFLGGVGWTFGDNSSSREGVGLVINDSENVAISGFNKLYDGDLEQSTDTRTDQVFDYTRQYQTNSDGSANGAGSVNNPPVIVPMAP